MSFIKTLKRTDPRIETCGPLYTFDPNHCNNFQFKYAKYYDFGKTFQK